tara:strand:- start:782 stop:1633 length:852 start_codon:yes stop_codon:yes gene_type:complete
MNKKFAFLISGSPRTFVIDEMINYYKSLIKIFSSFNISLDFFIILKLDEIIDSEKLPCDRFYKQYNLPKINFFNTKKGLNNFEIILNLLKPKHIIIFNKFNISNKMQYSQFKSIDIILNKAIEYSKHNDIEYNYYIRSRPDLMILNVPNLYNFNDSILYSSIKCDSKINDGFFFISKKLLNKWNTEIIQKIENDPYSNNNYPEGFLFNNFNVNQICRSILIRNYNLVQEWYPIPEKHFNNYFNINNDPHKIYIDSTLNNTDFIIKLNNILNYYNTCYQEIYTV